jgi:hypothetical protein
MVTYLPPVIAAVVGVALLGEELTWNQPVGGLVVLGGVAIAQGAWARLRRRPREFSDPGARSEPGALNGRREPGALPRLSAAGEPGVPNGRSARIKPGVPDGGSMSHGPGAPAPRGGGERAAPAQRPERAERADRVGRAERADRVERAARADDAA